MKLKITFLMLICFNFSAFSQTQNLANGGEVSSDFLRPGVVITTMNFPGVTPVDLGSVEKPKKFDNFDIDGNSAALSSAFSKDLEAYDKEVEAYVSSISGKVMAEFLYIENGKADWNKVMERSKNSMTESQRDVLKNLSGSLDAQAQSLLMEPMTGNNYVIVVSPITITSEVDDDGITVYTAPLVTSVYKVFMGQYEDENGTAIDAQGQINQFSATFGSDQSGVAKHVFPVKKIFSKSGGIASGYDAATAEMKAAAEAAIEEALEGNFIGNLINKINSLPKKIMGSITPSGEFNKSILDASIIVSTKAVDEFKTRAKVEEKMLIALGTKEGLKVDDRYFSYEKQKDPETREMILVRKGIDRVKKVGDTDVDLVADPNAIVERTKLYGDGGKKTRTGYVSMEAPEYGIGVSGFYRANPGARIDYRAGKLVGVTNLFIFVDAEFATLGDGNDPLEEYSGYIAAVGIQKNFNLGRMFALAPFAQYAATASFTDVAGNDIEIPVSYVAGGLRVIIKLGASLQLMPEVTYMYNLDDALETGSSLPNLYDEDLYFGGALRFNF